jgi:hypothetical protein
MDANAALSVLDQLASRQEVSPEDVQSAVNTLSHYVALVELLAPANTIADARSMLSLLVKRKKKTGLQYAVVNVLGDEFVVDAYDPGLDSAAYRMAEKELSRLLRLRLKSDKGVASLQRLSDVIGGWA